MTRGAIQNRRARMAWLLVGSVAVLVLAVAAPALAKHHARKPYKLWHQYPLRVQRRGARTKPGHASPSPSLTAATVATPHPIARGDSRSSATNVGLWVALAGGVGLVVIGLVAMRRQRPSPGEDTLRRRSDPGFVPNEDLPPPPAEPERAPRAVIPPPPAEPERAPRADIPRPPAEPESAPRADIPRPPAEPESAHGRDAVHAPAQPGPASDAESVPASAEPGLAPGEDSVAAPAGLAPGENSTQPVPATVATPETVPAPEHVRLQLADGRSLEGYKRNSPSTSPHLVILDILAAFDSEGNAAPTRPSDSFILESEISSIQRIDD